MKLAKHVVLAFGLACTGSTFGGSAASPNATPQSLQAAAGPDAPPAQASGDSKEAVEAIKAIAETAIKSAGADVETVKWIFTAMASLAALLGILGSVLGFLGFRTYSESRKLVQQKAEEESKNLSDLRSSISQMMTIQNFTIEANHDLLTSLADQIRTRQPSDQGYLEKSAHCESIAKHIIESLNKMREHDKVINRLAPNREPRSATFIDGWHGFTLLKADKCYEAIPYLERAIQKSRGRDHSAKVCRASHLYNLACCYAVLGKNDEALTNLKASLVLEPWRHLEAFNDKDSDKDLKGLWDDKRFVAIIGDAQSGFR